MELQVTQRIIKFYKYEWTCPDCQTNTVTSEQDPGGPNCTLEPWQLNCEQCQTKDYEAGKLDFIARFIESHNALIGAAVIGIRPDMSMYDPYESKIEYTDVETISLQRADGRIVRVRADSAGVLVLKEKAALNPDGTRRTNDVTS